MVSSRKSKRGTFPVPGIVWGSDGTDELTYTGELPKSFTGEVTKNVYKWSAKKPTRIVDKRDVEGIVKAAGGPKAFGELAEVTKPAPKAKEKKEE